jgi:hypothetical protein
MFSLDTASLFVTAFVCFVPGGSRSPEYSIVFGNHNACTSNISSNKSGIPRCPIVGLLCMGRNVMGSGFGQLWEDSLQPV